MQETEEKNEKLLQWHQVLYDLFKELFSDAYSNGETANQMSLIAKKIKRVKTFITGIMFIGKKESRLAKDCESITVQIRWPLVYEFF